MLNITIVVDSLLLLETGDIDRSVFLVDDSDLSVGKGTHHLTSSVFPLQMVRWTLVPVDLQAPGWVVGIDFVGAEPLPDPEPVPEGLAAPRARSLLWEGVVPPGLTPGQVFPYRILLNFGDGHRGTPLSVEGPSLTLAPSPTPDFPPLPADLEPVQGIEGLL